MIASSVSGSRDESMRFFTSVTSLPEVPLPILSCAVERLLVRFGTASVRPRPMDASEYVRLRDRPPRKPRSLHRRRDRRGMSLP
jgi:hypothetical protein